MKLKELTQEQIKWLFEGMMANYKNLVFNDCGFSTSQEYLENKLSKEDASEFYTLYLEWVSYDMENVENNRLSLSAPLYIFNKINNIEI